jgi:hypothetical protein
MLIRRQTLAKLRHIEQRCAKLRFEKIADGPIDMCETREHSRREPGRTSGL